jgi:hypothetical protein
LSKSLATITTQPLIVAKVGLQSKPPPARQGKPFKGFIDVMKFIVEREGPLALFKGIGPQILKGLLVQGILMMMKDRYVPTMHPSKLNGSCQLTVLRIELFFALFLWRLKMMRARSSLRMAAQIDAATGKRFPLIK